MSPLRILHLSDTHLFGDDSRHYGVTDTAEKLRLALAHVAGRRFDLVVCSGDVSEDGSEESYLRARDTVVPWARERGARAVFAMGNHDRREPFRAVLGGGQPDASERALLDGSTDDAPIASVVERDGWRVLVLDTSVPRRGYGELAGGQLDALRAELADPVEHGTVIVMHHPPVDAQTDLLQALALDADHGAKLLSIIRGSDVRVVLSGHYHLPLVETAAGVPVVVAPGVTNIARALDRPEVESSIDGYGGATVDVTPDRVRTVFFEERLTPDSEVFRMDEDTVAEVIASAGRSRS